MSADIVCGSVAVCAGGGEPVPRPTARRDGDARVALLAAHSHCGRARARGAHMARARALSQYALPSELIRACTPARAETDSA